MYHILLSRNSQKEHSFQDTITIFINNIVKVTDRKLALIIATHAPQDHMSGFGRFGDIFTKFEIGEIG